MDSFCREHGEKMTIIDCAMLTDIHERLYVSDEMHPAALVRKHERRGGERISRHGNILEQYHKLIDRQALLPSYHDFSAIKKENVGSLSYHVDFKPKQNISEVFYKTIAVLTDEDYSRFILAAEKSVRSGSISYTDGVFITDPLACPYQKQLSDF